MSNHFIIGVGTSYPKGKNIIVNVYSEISKYSQIQIIATSSMYSNPAFGGETLFEFTNSAIRLKTSIHPDALWFVLREIEYKFGRIRIKKNGARLIDLDILWSSIGIINTPYLTIPHPKFKQRPFALKAASDIGLR